MQPIWNEPALTFTVTVEGERRTYLVASELHLGIESELARKGAYLRSRSRGLASKLLELATRHKARHLILLGDIKHRIATLSPQERRDLPVFFETLGAFASVHIAVGNHDAGLRRYIPSTKFRHVVYHPATGFVVRGKETTVACLHGHAWPKPSLLAADTFLVGHTHAAIAVVRDGQPATEWAWLRGQLDPARVHAKYGRRAEPRVIVFPPFNPLCGGTAMNRQGLLGPFRKLVDPATAEVFLLDGSGLGTLETLVGRPEGPR